MCRLCLGQLMVNGFGLLRSYLFVRIRDAFGLECDFLLVGAVIAQLAARRSHNPKVVSSIITRRIFMNVVVLMW